MEQMYDRKVEGIIVRSRAMLYELRERNSKYFFNSKKRNYVGKHCIRKLWLSRVITVDTFEILEGEIKVFFISMNIKYTNDLLFDQSNIKSFNVQGPNFF